MPDEERQAQASAVEPSLDCRCNVVAILEAEAGYFRRLSQEEGEGPSAAFFELQAEYLAKLAQRFRDGLEFAERMKAALERPA